MEGVFSIQITLVLWELKAPPGVKNMLIYLYLYSVQPSLLDLYEWESTISDNFLQYYFCDQWDLNFYHNQGGFNLLDINIAQPFAQTVSTLEYILIKTKI